MKLRCSSIGAALVGAVLMSAAVVSSANAQAINPMITVDEFGNGTEQFNGSGPTPLTGVVMPDPGPGGYALSLTYHLMGSPSLTAGDLMITENGDLGDLFRFNPAGTGGVAGYPASLVFLSNPMHVIDSLADIPVRPTQFYPNVLTVPEIGGRVFYHPTEGQPGFIANFNVAYQIISDGVVPEPATWAMLILGVAMIGFAARRRRAGTAVAA